ncbi:MAG TPA: 23S rRNA (adenine(2030)-N(6))-methyltransferase RlmJ [Gammaproteobacteria bacterium]
MLSYRHAFHAGNFADVHKHAAWLLGIRSLQGKTAPFCLLDAYAGAGVYDLDAEAARKTGEWENGIGRLLEGENLPPALAAYRDAVREFNGRGRVTRCPGSPALAAMSLRERDRLVCLELHPADHPALKSFLGRDSRVHVHRRDAREGLPALLPPPEKRGLVLIDPPYEQAAEYSDVPKTILAACARWSTGSYLLWYPLLAGNPHRPMLAALADGGVSKMLVQELLLFPDAPGLRGSGIAWINPPWQADAALAETGDWLRRLGSPDAKALLDWRVPESASGSGAARRLQ